MFGFLSGYVMGERSAARAAQYSRSAASSLAKGPQNDIFALHDRIDRLLLVIDAMWDLMKEGGYTDEQLVERIKALDEADGSADGRRTAVPVMCTQCSSMISPGRDTCVFCGAASPARPDPLDNV